MTKKINKIPFYLIQASCRSTPSIRMFDNAQTSQQIAQPMADQQMASSSSRQQVSRPNNDDENPQPLQPPRNHQPINNQNDNTDEIIDNTFNKQNKSPVFELIGDNMVPGDPNKDEQNIDKKKNVPIPYKKNINDEKKKKSNNQSDVTKKSIIEVDNDIVDDSRQVLPMPNIDSPKKIDGKNSGRPLSNMIPIVKPQGIQGGKEQTDEQQRNIESPPRTLDFNVAQNNVATATLKNP